MSGASIETTLGSWASSLRDVKARVRPLFTQERVAASAGLFLHGLLGDERRKIGWMRAQTAGNPGQWRQQAILGRGGCVTGAVMAAIRHRANTATLPKGMCGTTNTLSPPLINWPTQEIRRIAARLARRRIRPANIIAWSLCRQAHQASARKAHLTRRMQL